MTTSAQDQLSALAHELELPIVLSFHGVEGEIVKVRLNRPKQLNCIPPALHNKFDAFWTKFEQLAPLRVAILTGTGRVFCAGADLKGKLTKKKIQKTNSITFFTCTNNYQHGLTTPTALSTPTA